jgi:hypothetical protein
VVRGKTGGASQIFENGFSSSKDIGEAVTDVFTEEFANPIVSV